MAADSALGDWSKRDDLRFTSSAGMYYATIALDEIRPDKRYVLDLGTLYSAADIVVNGQVAGHAIFSPYRVDISGSLKAGENAITVTVTPALRNRLLGKALRGDAEYAQFAGGGRYGNSAPSPCGLAGPVTLQMMSAPT